MGCKPLMVYAMKKRLFIVECLREIAEQHRMKTGEQPVIAVDGTRCVWYLYQNCDFNCGGQYKEFREECRKLVREFRDCGVRLVFFFHGVRPAEKNEKWVQMSKDNVERINQMMEKMDVRSSEAEKPVRLPEGVIPCARVIFRDEPSTEVRLCLEDYNRETAEFVASCGNCLGVLCNNGNFLVYKDIPRLFTYKLTLQKSHTMWMRYFCTSDITSDLGLERQGMPAFATFLGNGSIDPDELKLVHEGLGSKDEDIEKLICTVARLVKNRTTEEICQTAFGSDRWREFLESVKAGIGQYEYKPKPSGNDAESGSDWSRVLQTIESKHTSGEIPAVLLSVARRRTFRIGEVMEDLSQAESTSTGEALRPMRSRMYAVLLWESGDGPFIIEEQVTSTTGRYRQQVEVQKRLPPTLEHPGLLQLWTGDLDTRWRLFSWIVGSPDPEGSALRSLKPQSLVVPAAALSFLWHEARLLSPQEAEIFAVVAITVGRFSPQDLAQKHLPELDPHAVFLATLFVRTALHVLDAAAVCGLSFPREADCQLDSYFDGKLFHELYLKAKAQSFPRVGSTASWHPAYLGPFRMFLDVVEGTHIGQQ